MLSTRVESKYRSVRVIPKSSCYFVGTVLFTVMFVFQRGYDEFALFFHDTYGGSVIGVLLRPTALESKEFKVANVHGRKLNSDGKLILDVSAMIEDFSILGKGLVKKIEIQSKRIVLE